MTPYKTVKIKFEQFGKDTDQLTRFVNKRINKLSELIDVQNVMLECIFQISGEQCTK